MGAKAGSHCWSWNCHGCKGGDGPYHRANKSIALYKAVEEGVCHMWTVSAFQMHNNTLMVCDEDATLELRVRTVKYFKDMWNVHASLNEEISEDEMRKLSLGATRS